MLDLDSVLNRQTNENSVKETLSVAILYNSEPCQTLVSEAYQFEGFKAPEQFEYNDQNLKKLVEKKTKTIFIELNESHNISKDARQISHIIPHDVLVVIIGTENAISTIRNLKSLGFYYIFWPISKVELIDFVRNLSATSHLAVGLKGNRNAKRIAVIGTKGGIGCSLLSAEISGLLSLKHKTRTLLVDHNYYGGNCDIMLGTNTLTKRELLLGTLSDSLDEISAKNLTAKINTNLDYLGLTMEKQSPQALCEFSDHVINLLGKSVNFIVEDVSASINKNHDITWLCCNNDYLVLLLEPSISSLRAAKKIHTQTLEHIKNNELNIKLIIVLNHHRDKAVDTISTHEIKKILGCHIDYTLPYDVNTNNFLIRGKKLFNSQSQLAQPLTTLVADILGITPKHKKGLLKAIIPKLGNKRSG